MSDRREVFLRSVQANFETVAGCETYGGMMCYTDATVFYSVGSRVLGRSIFCEFILKAGGSRLSSWFFFFCDSRLRLRGVPNLVLHRISLHLLPF